MLTSILHRLNNRVILATSPARDIAGISVHVAFCPPGEREILFQKVEAALNLIAQYDPHRLHRLRSDLTAIVVWPVATYRAAINSTTRTCLLNRRALLADRGGIATATLLAHEGMHARLLQMGFPTDQNIRPRLERICKRAELHFLLHLPDFTGRERILARAEEEVVEVESQDYSSAARRTDLAWLLGDLDWPAWLIRLLTRQRPAD
jgi:hypothetical protein